MKNVNRIVVHHGHFATTDRVEAEIADAGLHRIEMDVPAVRNEAHWHAFSTSLYILEGELRITDTARGVTEVAGPGDRVDVPERVLHREDSAGYRIVAGMTALPEPGTEVDLPPEAL